MAYANHLAGLVLMIVATAMSAATAHAAGTTRAATTKPADPLDPVIASVDFADTPLEKALDALREQSGVNIVVHWPAVESAGLARDTPIDLRVRRLPLQ